MKKKVVLFILIFTVIIINSCVTKTVSEPMSFSITEGFKSLVGDNANIDNAMKHFNSVLDSVDAKKDEKDEARVGLGWAYLKKDDLERSIYNFVSVDKVSNDRNLGLASAYLARGNYAQNDNDFFKATEILKDIKINSMMDVQAFQSKLGITLAEAKALLAISYLNTGSLTLARKAINEAYQLDINNENTLIKQVKESFDRLDIN
jgi:Tfp pilus assembly protein PilF